jgi:hypothetical protein
MKVHRGLSPSTALVILVSCIFPLWLFLVLRQSVQTALDKFDWYFVFAVVLYALPFLLTASDPRYQIPLEICLLAHLARLWKVSPGILQR